MTSSELMLVPDILEYIDDMPLRHAAALSDASSCLARCVNDHVANDERCCARASRARGATAVFNSARTLCSPRDKKKGGPPVAAAPAAGVPFVIIIIFITADGGFVSRNRRASSAAGAAGDDAAAAAAAAARMAAVPCKVHHICVLCVCGRETECGGTV